jgi:glycosyltransferase involved in cell wall biosynthesis
MVESIIVGRKMGIPQVATFHVSWPFCIHGTFYNYSRKLSCLNKILCGECITHRSKVLSQMISTIYCNTIARRVLNAIDHYVCSTPYHLELLKSLGIDGSQATILPPGIHLLPQVEIKSFFERKYITYSGRLEEEKGVYLFLEVAKRFKSSDTEFLIIGNGYLKNELKKKAEEESLKIKFADWIENREDYFDLIGQSKMVIIPSLWPETFGMVILDAYQCGTPIIGTNMGGIPYVIENDKSGFIVSPEADEIVEKINNLLTNSSLWYQFSKCGLDNIAKKNTWRENALQLQKIYTSLLKR